MAVLQLFVFLLVVGPADAVVPLLVIHGRHEGVHFADFLAVVIGDKEFEAVIFLPDDVAQPEVVLPGEKAGVKLVLVGAKVGGVDKEQRAVGHGADTVDGVNAAQGHALQLLAGPGDVAGPVLRTHAVFVPVAEVAVLKLHDSTVGNPVEVVPPGRLLQLVVRLIQILVIKMALPAGRGKGGKQRRQLLGPVANRAVDQHEVLVEVVEHVDAAFFLIKKDGAAPCEGLAIDVAVGQVLGNELSGVKFSARIPKGAVDCTHFRSPAS